MAAATSVNVAPEWYTIHLQMIWRKLEEQVHPFSQVLCLEGNFYRELDNTAKQFIARKFMEHVEESVLYVIDGNGPDRVYLGAPRHFVSCGVVLRPPGHNLYWIRRSEPKITLTATMAAPPEPVKEIKIPRPPNAYILYRKERHNIVKNANPGITNNEISQILGRAWNMETREVRQKYKEMSEQVKQALLEKHPDYQYRPRRPSERRRRRRNTQGQNQSGNIAVGNATPLPSGGASAVTVSPAATGDAL